MYKYEDMKSKILTEDGLDVYIKTSNLAKDLLNTSGSFMMSKVMKSGDSWLIMACVDMMVERGEITEVTSSNTAGQHRVFVKA